MNKFCMHPSCPLRPQSSWSAPRIMTSSPIQFYLSYFSLSIIIIKCTCRCRCRCRSNTARQYIWEQEKWANHKQCWLAVIGGFQSILLPVHLFGNFMCEQTASSGLLLVCSKKKPTFQEGSKPVINRMFIQTVKSTLWWRLFSCEATVILCLQFSRIKMKSANQGNHLAKLRIVPAVQHQFSIG